jgi:uncharacterized FlaG/YvyC family protein
MNELVQNVTAAAPAAMVGFKAAPAPVNDTADKETENDRDQDRAGRPSRSELQATIDRMADLAFAGSHLAIEKHEGANTFVYRLIDSRNGSVMRQWPSEEFLELREYLRTRQGGLIDERI